MEKFPFLSSFPSAATSNQQQQPNDDHDIHTFKWKRQTYGCKRWALAHIAHTHRVNYTQHRMPEYYKETRLQTIIALNPIISLFCRTSKRTVFGFKKLMSTWSRRSIRQQPQQQQNSLPDRHGMHSTFSHAFKIFRSSHKTCARNLSTSETVYLFTWSKCGMRPSVRDVKN